MRRLLIAAAIALLPLTAHAQIFAGPKAYRVPAPPVEYDINLACTPGFDPTDRNPPRQMSIDLHIVDGKAVSMEVYYDLRNGERVFRSRQYSAQLRDDPSVFAGWTGTRLSNPRLSMAGGLWTTKAGDWFYREKLWKDASRVEWDYTAPCNRIDPG